MAFVIRDKATGETYQNRCGKGGWYDRDMTYARRYRTREGAERTIKAGNHHVTYPGTRTLEIVDEAAPATDIMQKAAKEMRTMAHINGRGPAEFMEMAKMADALLDAFHRSGKLPPIED